MSRLEYILIEKLDKPFTLRIEQPIITSAISNEITRIKEEICNNCSLYGYVIDPNSFKLEQNKDDPSKTSLIYSVRFPPTLKYINIDYGVIIV